MATLVKKSTKATQKKIKTGKDMLPLFGILKDSNIDSSKVRENAWLRKS